MKVIQYYIHKKIYYETKEERKKHSKEMIKDGWSFNDDYNKENIGTIQNPKFVYVGYYYKNKM